jgi:V/A-type H+-transporting ATPase subunit E
MAETIEAFVAKLQAEGVDAGRQEAQRIRAEAERQAQQVLQQARHDADRLMADAKAHADGTAARARAELALAVRDTVLRLQEALGRTLSAVLSAGVKQRMDDPAFLGSLLHDLVAAYVKRDVECGDVLKIDVPEDMRQKLIDWAMREIGQERVEKLRPCIDLKGTLKDAGFEYTLRGSTVEVTRESVVEVLMALVGPALREQVRAAAC